MTVRNYSKADFIALRTVPDILENGVQSLKVNVLIVEASTKAYVNVDVTAELGLHGRAESIIVNV